MLSNAPFCIRKSRGCTADFVGSLKGAHALSLTASCGLLRELHRYLLISGSKVRALVRPPSKNNSRFSALGWIKTFEQKEPYPPQNRPQVDSRWITTRPADRFRTDALYDLNKSRKSPRSGGAEQETTNTRCRERIKLSGFGSALFVRFFWFCSAVGMWARRSVVHISTGLPPLSGVKRRAGSL